MSKIILINGPIECGKSKAVEVLKAQYPLMERRCKDKLFELVPIIFNITPKRYWEIYNDRSLKEVPLPDFRVTYAAAVALRSVTGEDSIHLTTDHRYSYLSVREAMIYVSEVLCKPSFGQDYFGVARADSILEDEIAIDDSTGFAEELPPTIRKLGQENILLIRVRGRGSYTGDSRNFIPDGIVDNTVDIYNTGTEEAYLSKVHHIVKGFLKS